MTYIATIDGQEYRVDLEASGLVTVDDVSYQFDLEAIDGGFHYSLLVGAAAAGPLGSVEVFVERCEDVCTVTLEGHRYQVRVEDERLRRLGRRPEATLEAGEAEVTSPMPGLVVAVLVQEGQVVQAGEGLLILEAMKMENEIRAPRSGAVEQLKVAPGQRVSQHEILVRIGSPHAEGRG